MRTRKNCYIYESCQHVPCGKSMNKCHPSYCYPKSKTEKYSSRNWSKCNVNKKYCLSEKGCRLKKTAKTTNTVDALELHRKMPYIWRFLKPKTRKHMIDLANKKVKDIDIPFSIFPDYDEGLNKKKRKEMIKLRKKYKDI